MEKAVPQRHGLPGIRLQSKTSAERTKKTVLQGFLGSEGTGDRRGLQTDPRQTMPSA